MSIIIYSSPQLSCFYSESQDEPNMFLTVWKVFFAISAAAERRNIPHNSLLHNLLFSYPGGSEACGGESWLAKPDREGGRPN